MENAASPVTPCLTTLQQADTAEHAKTMAECQYPSYKATQITCGEFEGGLGCPSPFARTPTT
jgi:hypothetical protein